MTLVSKVSGLLPDKAFVAAIARAHKRFEPELGRIVASFPGGDVLDVGAWYGPWTYWLAKKAGRVVAFEPNPGVATVLERCVPSNVTVRRAAASDANSHATLTLPVGGRGTEGRASLEGLDDAGHTVDVETVRLDDLDLAAVGITNLTMVKVDVEGHERAALAGGLGLLSAHHPLLVVEIEERHGGIAGTVDLLAGIGYSGQVLVEDRWVPLAEFDLAGHQTEYLEKTAGGSYLQIIARRGAHYINNVVFTHPETTWNVH